MEEGWSQTLTVSREQLGLLLGLLETLRISPRKLWHNRVTPPVNS